MKKRRLIPFGLMPGSWGLSGRSRQIAEAEYYYQGYDLDLALNDIENHDNDYLRAQGKLEIDLSRHKITQKEYLESSLSLKLDHGEISQQEHDLDLLEIQLFQGDITEQEHDKQRATLLNEPYVNVLEMGMDRENVYQGYMELDWNDAFVQMLQDAGIKGTSDEDVVNRWFNGLCRSIIVQDIADLDFGLESRDPTLNDETLEKTDRPDVLRRTNPPGPQDTPGTE